MEDDMSLIQILVLSSSIVIVPMIAFLVSIILQIAYVFIYKTGFEISGKVNLLISSEIVIIFIWAVALIKYL
jgi:hypothetical protein